MRKLFPFAITLLSLSSGLTLADVSRVQVIYVDDFAYAAPLVDLGNVALDAGGEENGDGAAFQIGYFDGVSSALDPADFGDADWKSFSPLTGAGSPNEGSQISSIGDFDSRKIGPFGFLFFPEPVAFTLDPNVDHGLPDSYPARLGLRFYDGVTPETSSAYNIVTSFDPLWRLLPPEPDPASTSILNLDDHSLVWASGALGTFQTAMLLIPEPGSVLLLSIGVLALGIRRRHAAQ